MPETSSEQSRRTEEEFRAVCLEQIKRLGVFDAFRFMDATARKEFRRFFEAKTRDVAKIERVIDEAVTLDSMPTIAELHAIWNGLFPQVAPEVAAEERQVTAQWMRDWYEQERKDAATRRATFAAQGNFRRQQQPITDADIAALKRRQEDNRRRIAEFTDTETKV